MLKKKATPSEGTVQIKKPGKMRWDYTAPEKKLFVSDGSTIYLYVPADKQVIVSPVPADDSATTAVLFLAGKGNLARDFTVSLRRSAPAGHLRRCGSTRNARSATTTGSSSWSTARRCRSAR